MMDKVYFQAEQVLVWLGERSRDGFVDKVFRYGKDHAKHHEEAPYDLFALNSRFDTWWYRAWTYQEAVSLPDCTILGVHIRDDSISAIVGCQFAQDLI